MGLFGNKKDAGKPAAGSARKPVTEVPQSTRKSVRRVVAAGGANKTTVSTGPAAPIKQATQRIQAPAPSRPAANAVPEPSLEDIQMPPPSFDNELDLGSAPNHVIEPTPTRPATTKPILASSAPDFSGSLGGGRKGPSRTGDQVLLEFLTGKAGLMTAEQANGLRAKAEADQLSLDECAVRMGLITEDQLVNSLSQETWVPHLKVDKYEIRKKALDTIAREDAQHFGVFPVDKLGNLLTLAMVNPLDAEAIRQLEAKTGLDIKKVVATRGEVLNAIDKYYGGKVVASEGSRSFSQDVSDQPAKSATQMLSRPPADEPIAMPPGNKAFEITPTRTAQTANIQPDIAADIQDIDDLLGGEETIAPAIIEPVSIKPEESNDALELNDAPITQAVARDSELEFGLHDAPKAGTGALARSTLDVPSIDLEKTDAIALPELASAAPAAVKPPVVARPARLGELPSATARIAAGNAGSKVVNLVPVLEEEFRYAISHGKRKVFERWVALQSRNRIVNAVTVEREFDGVLAGLYAGVRRAG